MIIRSIAVALAASATLCGASIAQTQDPVSNPRGIVSGYDIVHIEPILKEMGLTTETANTSQPGISAAPVVVGRGGGVTIVFTPWACNSPRANKCAGLIMRAYYPKSTSDALRNTFNTNWQMGSVVGAGDITYLQRYLIGDYGYTRGAFAVDVGVFARVASELLTVIQNGGAGTTNQVSFDVPTVDTPTPQASNAPPGKPMPGDDLADSLNAQQKIGNAVSIPAPSSPATAHDQIGRAPAETLSVSAPDQDYLRLFMN